MSAIVEYEKVCEMAVRRAGATLLEWQGRFSAREKGPADLVTEADFASQEVVRQVVLDAFPTHSVLGEEDPKGHATPRTPYRWIVDPLDGTTNYVHGLPFFSVSLALEHEGELLVGAIYNPVSGDCFSGVRGRGAFLNGAPIQCSDVASLDKAIGVVGFAARVERNSAELAVFLEVLNECQSMRRTGSAALNLAYMAAGWIDFFWSFSTKVWDVAAGALILQEAGGIITSPTGGPFVLDDGRFLASANAPLHTQFQALVDRVLATSGA